VGGNVSDAGVRRLNVETTATARQSRRQRTPLDDEKQSPLEEWRQARTIYIQNKTVHIRYIHEAGLPHITPSEVVVMAACSPFFSTWRTALPDRPPVPLPPLHAMSLPTSKGGVDNETHNTKSV
jgi:hypothetical protein